MQKLPTHPFTGLTAIGLTRRGRPVWPVLGGDGNGGGDGSGGGGQGGGDPAGQGNNGGQGGGGEPRTFTQEQLDAILQDRLARERQKYSDYEDIKAKAEKFDEHQKAQQTDLEKLQSSYEEVLGRAELAEKQLLIERAAREHKVRNDLVEFIDGANAEEIAAKAKKLGELSGNGGDGGGANNGGDQGAGGTTGGRPDPSQGAGSSGAGTGGIQAGRELYKQQKQKT